MYQHPSDLRLANTRRTYRSLLRSAPCSRADLARETGISAVTVGKVVDDLIAAGIAEEVGTPTRPGLPSGPAWGRGQGEGPALGRPPRLVALASTPTFIGVEIGVRSSMVAALTVGGAVVPVSAADGVLTVNMPGEIGAAVEAIRGAAAQLPLTTARGLLVSVPGILDSRNGELLLSPNMRWAEGTRLLSDLGRAFDLPVCAVQEVRALALGHQAAGGAPESFLLLEFTDGMGGAIIAQGSLMESPMPISGEIGHTPVHGNTRRCGCGAVGCVETLVNREGLLQSFREATRSPRAKWADMEKKLASTPELPGWLGEAIDAAAAVVVGAVNLVGLRHVVVTGHLPQLHPLALPRLAEGVKAHSLLGRIDRVSVEQAPQRRWLGLVAGAADRLLFSDDPNSRLGGRVVVVRQTGTSASA
jgi:N-acetylglucosamine repressor